MENKKLIRGIGLSVLILVLALWVNPMRYNDPTQRTVVTQQDGTQFVRVQPGIFYAGFFASEYEWPNQIGVQYQGDVADLKLKDNTIDIGATRISFLGGPTATVQGIAQFNLPNDQRSMLDIHNQHKTVEGLVKLRLAPYTIECLKASAQLMTPEMHYNGGATQMGNEYLDQLQNGVFLLESRKVTVYDTLEKTYKADYAVVKQRDRNKTPLRKRSSVAKYQITIGDGQITSTEYEERIKLMLGKQIDAQSATQLAKQQYITAQQQALTAAAQGQKKLVETEYTQKIAQTSATVQAQTEVQLAEQDRQKQEIAYKAAILESQTIKVLADANAYDKEKSIRADGALDKKLATYEKVQANWAAAFKDFQGSIVPQIQTGGNGAGNGALNFVELMSMKAAKDLSLDLRNK